MQIAPPSSVLLPGIHDRLKFVVRFLFIDADKAGVLRGQLELDAELDDGLFNVFLGHLSFRLFVDDHLLKVLDSFPVVNVKKLFFFFVTD